MKQDERKVYVISGKLVPYDDGSGVSVTDSDNSIIIRDSETGALEQVSPDAVLSLDESQDPNEQKKNWQNKPLWSSSHVKRLIR